MATDQTDQADPAVLCYPDPADIIAERLTEEEITARLGELAAEARVLWRALGKIEARQRARAATDPAAENGREGWVG